MATPVSEPMRAPRRLEKRPAFTMLELLLSVSILSITSLIAYTVFDPQDEVRTKTSESELEQLGQAIVLYNLNNPGNPFEGSIYGDSGEGDVNQPMNWWMPLGPDFSKPDLRDPWGQPYNHKSGRGMVYSFGPNGEDEDGEGDDTFYYYRPPSAFVKDRSPSPDQTVADREPNISATWQFRGSSGVTSATIFVDGAARAATLSAGPDDSTTVSYQILPAEALTDGSHQVLIRAEDGDGLRGRTQWNFRVDATGPQIYSIQPANGTTTSFNNFPTVVYYRDNSAVDLTNAQFQVLDQCGTSSMNTGALLGRDDILANLGGSVGVEMNGSSLLLTPPPGGWEFCSAGQTYRFRLTVTDSFGNTPATTTWQFQVADTSAPFINIQIPAHSSTITSSDDLDADQPGVQIELVGTTEPEATVEFRVHQPDRVTNPIQVPQTIPQTVQADSSGNFRFRGVTVRSVDTILQPVPENTIQVMATDKEGNVSIGDDVGEPSWKSLPVFVYDDASSVKIVYAEASPQTTQPNRPIEISVGATGGTTPYDVTFDFDDGYQLSGIMPTQFTTTTDAVSKSHTYLTTGNFNVTVKVKDANDLEDSRVLSVYVGNESSKPKIRIEAVPPEFGFAVAGSDRTVFKVTIEGSKFLGNWRLKVNNASKTNTWWFTGDDCWVAPAGSSTNACRNVDAEPGEDGSLWQSASSNSFNVEWIGNHNVDGGVGSEYSEANPSTPDPTRTDGKLNSVVHAFRGNNPEIEGDLMTATLEYRDAFGNPSEESINLRMFNDKPGQSRIFIVGVEGDTSTFRLFDANYDGLPDYSSSCRVDLFIPLPGGSNNTHLWISNYPTDLWLLVPPGSLPGSMGTTWSLGIEAGLRKRGEVFPNDTLADGEFFDATDGSSGWIPHRPDGSFTNWDLCADMATLTGPPVSSDPFIPPTTAANPCPGDARCPDGFAPGDLHTPGTGLSLRYGDGPRSIYAAFQAVGPILSTQEEDSNPREDGVTWTSIELDTTPPTHTTTVALNKVEILNPGTANALVIAELQVGANDAGAGMIPRGKTVVSIPNQPDVVVPYQELVSVNFGKFSDLSSGSGDLAVTATISYQDNLGNPSVPSAATTETSRIELSLRNFVWTNTGIGDLTYFQSTLNPDETGVINNTGFIDHARIQSFIHPDHDGPPTQAGVIPSGTPYTIADWLQAASGNVPEGSIDGATDEVGTNIDPLNFPNVEDRLAVLEAIRPPDPGNPSADQPGGGNPFAGVVEASQTFPVDNGSCYILTLERRSGDAFYTVRKRPRGTNDPCTTVNSPSTILVNYTEIVAQVDKVAIPAANRLNFGVIRLPRDIGATGTNTILGREADLWTTSPAPILPEGQYAKDDYWDRRQDVIESSDRTQIKTYAYRGVIGDFDSGTVDNIAYKVAVDNFTLRAFFTDNPGDCGLASGSNQASWSGDSTTLDYELVATVSGAPGGVPPKMVKVAHFDNPDCGPLSPLNFGLGTNTTGLHAVATQILDDEEAPGSGSNPTGVGGRRFKLKLADHSTAFQHITTGSLFAGGYIYLDRGGSGLLPGEFACNDFPAPCVDNTGLNSHGATNVPNDIHPFYVDFDRDGSGPGNIYDNPYPLDTAGTPDADPFPAGKTGDATRALIPVPGRGQKEFHFDWTQLGGYEGTIYATLIYKDGLGNRVGPVTTSAQVDSKPPEVCDIQLRGYPEATHDILKTSGSLSGSHWTSSPEVKFIVDKRESSQLYREFFGGDIDTGSAPYFGIDDFLDPKAGNAEGCGAPNFLQNGPSPCDPSNWTPIGSVGGSDIVSEIVDIVLNHQGEVKATFRFRDAFFNILPPVASGAPFIGDNGPLGGTLGVPPSDNEPFFGQNGGAASVASGGCPSPGSQILDPGQTSHRLFRDPAYPFINSLNMFVNASPPQASSATATRISTVGGKVWTNDRNPRFVTEFEDDTTDEALSVGFRLGGANFFLEANGEIAKPSPDAPGSANWADAFTMPGEDHTPNDALAFTNDLSDYSDCGLGAPCRSVANLPAVSVSVDTYFKVLIQDSLGNVNFAAPAIPANGSSSYGYVHFGYDDEGPTIQSASLAPKSRWVPGYTQESVLIPASASGTFPVGAARLFDAPLDISGGDLIYVSLDTTSSDNPGGTVQITDARLLTFAGGTQPLNWKGAGPVSGSPRTLAVDDPSTWTQAFDDAAIGGFYTGIEVDLVVAGGGGSLRFFGTGARRTDSSTGYFSVEEASGLPPLRPHLDTVPARGGFLSATDLVVDFAEIQTAADDGAGVGLHPDDRTDADGAAQEWQFQAYYDGAAQTATLTDTPLVKGLASFPSDAVVRLDLRALDRLTNIGPALSSFEVTLDNTPPDRVTGLNIDSFNADEFQAGNEHFIKTAHSLTFTGVSDVDPAGPAVGSGRMTYRAYRSLGYAADPIPNDSDWRGQLIAEIDATAATDDGGTPRSFPFELLTDGSDDGSYFYWIESEDQAGNAHRPPAAAAPTVDYFHVTMDNTPPQHDATDVDILDTSLSSILINRDPSIYQSGGSGIDTRWTTDPNLVLRIDTEDMGINHAGAPGYIPLGTGVKEIEVTFDGASQTIVPGDIPGTVSGNDERTSDGGLRLDIHFPAEARALGLIGPAEVLADVQGRREVSALATDRLNLVNADYSGSPYFFHYDTIGPDFNEVSSNFVACFNTGTPTCFKSNGDLTALPYPGGTNVTFYWPQTTGANEPTDPGYGDAPSTGIGIDLTAGNADLYNIRISSDTMMNVAANDAAVGPYPPLVVTHLGSGTLNAVTVPLAGFPNGVVQVRASDQLGNISDAAQELRPFSLFSDTDPPTVTIEEIVGGPTLASSNPPGVYLNTSMVQSIEALPATTCTTSASCTDTTTGFWVRGTYKDGLTVNGEGSGFDFAQGKMFDLTVTAEAGGATYTEVVNSATAARFLYTVTNTDSGSAVKGDWYAFIVSPLNLGADSRQYRDEARSTTLTDITYRFQVNIQDVAGNTASATDKFVLIDEHAPQTVVLVDVEDGGGWVNIAEVNDGGTPGWYIQGTITDGKDIVLANSDIEVRDSGGTPYASMVFEDLDFATAGPGNAATWDHTWDPGQALGYEDIATQIVLRMVDKAGNQRVQQAGTTVQFDSIPPNPTTTMTVTSICVAPPYGEQWLSTDCGDTYPDAFFPEAQKPGETGYPHEFEPAFVSCGALNYTSAVADTFFVQSGGYAFRMRARDQAGNIGTNESVVGYTGFPINNAVTVEGSAGWIGDPVLNDANGLRVSGSFTDGEVVEVKVTYGDDSAYPGWGVGGDGYVNIQNTAHANILAFTQGPIAAGGYTVDLAAAVFAGTCAHTGTVPLKVHTRVSNCAGTRESENSLSNLDFDTIAPTIVTNWDVAAAETPYTNAAPVDWFNISDLADGLDLEGDVTETCSGFDQGSSGVRENFAPLGSQTSYSALSGATANGTQTWSGTIPSGQFTGIDAQVGTIQVRVVDVAGNVNDAVAGGPTANLDNAIPTATNAALDPSANVGSVCNPGDTAILSFDCSNLISSALENYARVEFEYDPPGGTSWQTLSTVTPGDEAQDCPNSGTILNATIDYAAVFGTYGSGDYKFRVQAYDQANNQKTSSGATNINQANDPAGTITNAGHLAQAWLTGSDISGGINIAGGHTGADKVEVRLIFNDLTTAATEWGDLAWVDIESGDARVASGVRGGSTWSVTIPSSVFTQNCRDAASTNDIAVQARFTNCSPTDDIQTHATVQIDKLGPVVENNWAPSETESFTNPDTTDSWFNISDLGDGIDVGGDVTEDCSTLDVASSRTRLDFNTPASNTAFVAVAGASANGTQAWTATIPNTEMDGRDAQDGELRVRAVDVAGNITEEVATGTATYLYDDVAPSATDPTPNTGSICVAADDPRLTFACSNIVGNANANFAEIRFQYDAPGGGTVWVDAPTTAGGTVQICPDSVTNLEADLDYASIFTTPGNYFFRVQLRDQAGNTTNSPGTALINRAQDPTGSIDATGDLADTWLNATEIGGGITITGVHSNATAIDIRLTDGGAAVPEWDSDTAWVEITSGDTRVSGGTIGAGTWSVTIPAAQFAGASSDCRSIASASDLQVEARFRNCSVVEPTDTEGTIQIDKLGPVISNNWAPTEVANFTNGDTTTDWFNTNNLSDGIDVGGTVNEACSTIDFASSGTRIDFHTPVANTTFAAVSGTDSNGPQSWSATIANTQMDGRDFQDGDLRVRAVDDAGNSTEEVAAGTTTYFYDDVPPANVDPTANQASICVAADDPRLTFACSNLVGNAQANFGQVTFQYDEPGGGTTWNNVITTAGGAVQTCPDGVTNLEADLDYAAMFTAPGNYSFRVVLRDQAGNTTNSTGATIINQAQDPSGGIDGTGDLAEAWLNASEIAGGITITGTHSNATAIDIRLTDGGVAVPEWGGNLDWVEITSGDARVTAGSIGTGPDVWTVTIPAGQFAGASSDCRSTALGNDLRVEARFRNCSVTQPEVQAGTIQIDKIAPTVANNWDPSEASNFNNADTTDNWFNTTGLGDGVSLSGDVTEACSDFDQASSQVRIDFSNPASNTAYTTVSGTATNGTRTWTATIPSTEMDGRDYQSGQVRVQVQDGAGNQTNEVAAGTPVAYYDDVPPSDVDPTTTHGTVCSVSDDVHLTFDCANLVGDALANFGQVTFQYDAPGGGVSWVNVPTTAGGAIQTCPDDLTTLDADLDYAALFTTSGTYTFRVQLRDQAGNTLNSSGATTIDQAQDPSGGINATGDLAVTWFNATTIAGGITITGTHANATAIDIRLTNAGAAVPEWDNTTDWVEVTSGDPRVTGGSIAGGSGAWSVTIPGGQFGDPASDCRRTADTDALQVEARFRNCSATEPTATAGTIQIDKLGPTVESNWAIVEGPAGPASTNGSWFNVSNTSNNLDVSGDITDDCSGSSTTNSDVVFSIVNASWSPSLQPVGTGTNTWVGAFLAGDLSALNASEGHHIRVVAEDVAGNQVTVNDADLYDVDAVAPLVGAVDLAATAAAGPDPSDCSSCGNPFTPGTAATIGSGFQLDWTATTCGAAINESCFVSSAANSDPADPTCGGTAGNTAQFLEASLAAGNVPVAEFLACDQAGNASAVSQVGYDAVAATPAGGTVTITANDSDGNVEDGAGGLGDGSTHNAIEPINHNGGGNTWSLDFSYSGCVATCYFSVETSAPGDSCAAHNSASAGATLTGAGSNTTPINEGNQFGLNTSYFVTFYDCNGAVNYALPVTVEYNGVVDP